MHLGTCEYLYHPICLINLMVNRRCCAMCKAPFHKCLYELFGLVKFMPPSWEFDVDNAHDHPSKWKEDQVWNWRYKYHSLKKSRLCDQWGWKNDPDAIVNVCHHLFKGTSEASQGQRNFFFQCFNRQSDIGMKTRKNSNLGPTLGTGFGIKMECILTRAR